MVVTTPERTAFDLGRLVRGDRAVAYLDALAGATGFEAVAVAELARRHAGPPGLPRQLSALELHDAGAQSPKEPG